MSVSNYTFVLCNSAGKPLREIENATSRNWTPKLSAPAIASFVVPASTPNLKEMITEDTMLKVYNGSTLAFWGQSISAEYDGTNGTPDTVACTYADPSVRLATRLCGRTKNGKEYASQDKAEIARQVLTEVEGAGTGLGPHLFHIDAAYTCGSNGPYVAGPYRNILEVLGDLGHSTAGFDWIIEPTEKYFSEARYGRMRIEALIKTVQQNAILEYGCGKNNMSGLSFIRDKSTMNNRNYGIPANNAEPLGGAGGQTAENKASVEANGLYEEVIDSGGLTNETTLKQWLEANVAVRGTARKIMTMQPSPTQGPQFGSDYFLGDEVTARAVRYGVQLFNGQCRVYAVSVDIDSNGVATAAPTLVAE